jgi:hypothetical protein
MLVRVSKILNMVNRNGNEHLLFYDVTTMAVVLVTTINGVVKHQKQQQMQHWKHKSRTSKANSTLKFTFTNVTRVQACKRRSIGDRGIPLHFQRHRDERATDAHGTSCICSLSRQHPG